MVEGVRGEVEEVGSLMKDRLGLFDFGRDGLEGARLPGSAGEADEPSTTIGARAAESLICLDGPAVDLPLKPPGPPSSPDLTPNLVITIQFQTDIYQNLVVLASPSNRE